MLTKQCKKCNQIKQATEFYTNKQMKDGLGSWCKCCVKERAAASQKANGYRYQRDYHNRTKPYLYEITDHKTGEFYFGSSKRKWCARGSHHKFTMGRDDFSIRKTYFETIEEARGAETLLIAKNIDNPLCANKAITNKKLVGSLKPRKNRLKSKEIYQLNHKNEIIAEWSSLKEAAEALGLNQSGISKVLTGRASHYKGTYWETKTYCEPVEVYEVK